MRLKYIVNIIILPSEILAFFFGFGNQWCREAEQTGDQVQPWALHPYGFVPRRKSKNRNNLEAVEATRSKMCSLVVCFSKSKFLHVLVASGPCHY